jgi:uncharacterized protein (DUF433 family)
MTKEIIFPENSKSFIEEILKKYGLEEKQRKDLEKIFQGSNNGGRGDISLIEKLPASQISRAIRFYAENKKDSRVFIEQLTEGLKITEDVATNIYKELKTGILDKIKITENAGETKDKIISETEKPENGTRQITPKIDSYRENVE